jgi:hypothetical protein
MGTAVPTQNTRATSYFYCQQNFFSVSTEEKEKCFSTEIPASSYCGLGEFSVIFKRKIDL